MDSGAEHTVAVRAAIAASVVQRLQTWLEGQPFDAILLRTRANFAWLTGGGDSHIILPSEFGVADLIVFVDRVVCVTNSIEQLRIQEEELAALGCHVIAPDWSDGVESTLRSVLDGCRVGVDAACEFGTSVASELAELRRTLTDAQIEQYRWVTRETAQAIESVARRIRPGQTEFEVAGLLTGAVTERGLAPTVALVATDERAMRYRHPIPTGKRLDRYAMLVVCAEKYGLVANATRFVHFGALPAELTENAKKCAYIDARMNAATRPGRTMSEVFQTAVDAYAEVGYPDDWRWLHQGGPTGFASREFLATPYRHERIAVNQAFAWNPAIHGIKSEDTLLVKAEGNEFLTHTGEWPYIVVQQNGVICHRPDILVRPTP